MRRFGLASLTTTLSLAVAGRGAVHGVVRGATSDAPIAGALIEVIGTDRRTWSDVAGRYRFDSLSCAPCRLRISASRYDTAVVEVSLEPETDVALDIYLEAEPTTLERVAVIADSTRRAFGRLFAAAAPAYDHDAIQASTPGGDPDPLRMLEQSGQIAALPDLTTSLHVRGGGSSDNLVLFDGIPIYSPYHGGGTLSAIAPEVVEAAVLDDNVPSARYGGGLASTIELESRQPAASSLSAEGGLSTTAVRQSIMGQLPAGIGTLVAEARESARPWHTRADDGSARGFADATGVLTFRMPVGALELVGFRSSDHVGFDANVHDESSTVGPGRSENRFAWSAASAGAIWSARVGDGVDLAARVWYADAVSGLAWNATGTPFGVSSTLHTVGTSVEATWSIPNGELLTGASAERLATAYRVGPLDLTGSPVVDAAYAEGRWSFARRWSVVTGLRQELVGARSMFDPRVAVRYAISPALAVSGGFSRTDQVVQSLRNEESIIDLVLPAPLPAAGDRGVPIARADQWTGSLDAVVAPHTTITIDGYSRSTADLVSVAAATTEPFVLDRWTNGAENASGLTVAIARRGDRLALSAAYSLEAVRSHADSTAFTPASASPRSIIAELGYRLGAGMTIGAEFWAADGRPTSLVADPFDWKATTAGAGAADLAGTPERISGPVDSRRLPPYRRVDVGLSRVWRRKVGPRDVRLETRLTVTNALNETNVAGLVQPPGTAAARRFVLMPRSLTFGLIWAY